VSYPTVESRSPQNPDDVVITVPDSDAGAVDAAVGKALAAARSWAGAPALERAGLLNTMADRLGQRAEEFAGLMVREVGKPIGESRAEVTRGVAILRYHAQAALDPDGETYPSADGRTLLMARTFPRGVVGLITPWNFPVAIPLWKAAPALAYGNAVLLKPSPESSACALALATLGDGLLPEDVFQVVTGGGAAGEALVADERVAAISFTGSRAVGTLVAVAAASRGAAYQTEMGGQNASVVLGDADVGAAASTIATAAMGYAGQKCTATSRAIVVGDPREFTEALVDSVETLGFGDPASPDVAVGPVITDTARRNVMDAARDAEAAGGRVLSGGNEGDGAGYFVSPLVVDRVDRRKARLTREEVFGPTLAILSARDPDEAIAMANEVDLGLVGAVFTRDLDRALEVAGRLETGLVRVNAPTSGVDFHAPFGGEKGSSAGPREQGKAARAFYTSARTISIAPAGAER
jgi:alpha-ketoglutaric semialdehyde dehydrogenase